MSASSPTAFLTKTGHACTPARQEFILLSDVLGLSALVNLMHDATAQNLGTESSLLGPFYQQDAPSFALGDSIAVAADGAPLQVYGQVTDNAGHPVPGATLQVWQADPDGTYDLQRHDGTVMDLRGNFVADAEGRFHFRTLLPTGYPIPLDGPVGSLVTAQRRHGHRPAHIHVLVGAPGYRELVTALYLAGDPHIASDTVFGVSRSLVVSPVAADPAAPLPGMPAIRYDFQLAPTTEGHATRDNGGRVGADLASIMTAN